MSKSPFNWRDGRPSIFAKDAAKLGANRIGGTGKPPAKSHPLRNGTSSINTEKADRAGKTRKLTRSLS